MVNGFVAHGWTVGVCGKRATTAPLQGIKYKSWDYIDVDSDVEMIQKCKVVVTQESGLAYLAMMCQKRMFVIDRCHKQIADAHRPKGVFFKEFLPAWGDPKRILPLMKDFMHKYYP
jgi:hypothetical protein